MQFTLQIKLMFAMMTGVEKIVSGYILLRFFRFHTLSHKICIADSNSIEEQKVDAREHQM